MDTVKLDNVKVQMRKGVLEYCILIILSQGKYYPSDIIQKLNEAKLKIVEGTLYTLLNRLRREGKLDYEWQESPKGPPRKYYFITSEGTGVLEAMKDAWHEINNAIIHLTNSQSTKL